MRDSLETVSGTVVAHEWFVQGTQTLTPRSLRGDWDRQADFSVVWAHRWW